MVRLPGRAGVSRTGKPPVRIFLGTEDGQWRAERIFLFSIEQVRDPARDYEIYFMKNLAGFDRRRWRTGFTNYRFAIPELAGGAGRAIYNDVDQIYLDDPAKLFDLPLAEHGYLSVSAEDTSVMLLDCEKMRCCWDLARAQAGSKSQLLKSAGRNGRLWGALDGRWNARDTEYPRDEIRLLHYTALHLQPWQPFPETYSYHDNPMSDLWFDLERRADACGYRIFTRIRPSQRFSHGLSTEADVEVPDLTALQEFVAQLGARSMATVSAAPPGPTSCAAHTGVTRTWHTFTALPDQPSDVVAASGLAENLAAEDVPWILDELFVNARAGVFVAVNAVEAATEDVVDAGRTLRTPDWWQAQLVSAARQHPNVAWQLQVSCKSGTRLIEADLQEKTPNVWVLEGHRLGDSLQLRRIAEALGWPYRSVHLHYNPTHMLPGFLLGASSISVASADKLAPPWPDLVIASGKRSSPVARWIKRQSGGRTRIVNVGRPWSRLDAFDLIITTPQYRLPARPNTLHLSLPITSRTRHELAEARRTGRVSDLPAPRIAVLVGGNSTSCTLTTRSAAALGGMVDELASSHGGSLLLSGSPRTPTAAFRVLAEALSVPSCKWDFRQTDRENPYLDYLTAADEIVVTGDSVSMLADALATGRPVRVYPLPPSVLARFVSALQAPAAWWTGRRQTYRGTPKQQGRGARWYDRLVELGVLTPPRDLNHLHEVLAMRGLINGARSRDDQDRLAEEELCRAVERIRLLFHSGSEVRAW